MTVGEYIKLRWVSLEDELPPIGVYVHIIIKNYSSIAGDYVNVMTIGRMDKHSVSDRYAFVGKSGRFLGGTVTHWMEMPPMPNI